MREEALIAKLIELQKEQAFQRLARPSDPSEFAFGKIHGVMIGLQLAIDTVVLAQKEEREREFE